jgi:hypothetical protein
MSGDESCKPPTNIIMFVVIFLRRRLLGPSGETSRSDSSGGPLRASPACSPRRLVYGRNHQQRAPMLMRAPPPPIIGERKFSEALLNRARKRANESAPGKQTSAVLDANQSAGRYLCARHQNTVARRRLARIRFSCDRARSLGIADTLHASGLHRRRRRVLIVGRRGRPGGRPSSSKVVGRAARRSARRPPAYKHRRLHDGRDGVATTYCVCVAPWKGLPTVWGRRAIANKLRAYHYHHRARFLAQIRRRPAAGYLCMQAGPVCSTI